MRHSAPLAAIALALLSAVPAGAQGLAPTVPVEVFVGKQEFADDLGLADQELAGFRLGLDVASYAGIRGYYWRGLNDERDGWAPIQSFGIEAQLNLNAGNGLTPFLVGGVGRVDFMEGYAEDPADQPGDRDAFIAGAGVRFDLGRVGITAAARNYLFENDAETGDDLVSNVQYSAGLAFRLGRGRREPARVLRETPDTVYLSRDAEGRAVEREERAQGFVTIPIPREGEVYLRYGPADSAGAGRRPNVAAGVTTEAELEAVRLRLLADLRPVLRELLEDERAEVRAMIRREMESMAAAGLTPAAEQRLLEALEARLTLRMRDELGGPVLVDTTGRVVVARQAPRRSRFEPGIREVRPYLGANVDHPGQFLVGVRLDMGPFDAARPRFRLVPDANFGVGQGTASFMVASHAQYDGPVLNAGGGLQPYVYAGPGALFFSDPPRGRARGEAVLNVGYGINFGLGGLRAGARGFIEHQGIDVFDLNRVIIGLRI